MVKEKPPGIVKRFITRRPLALFAICYALGAALGALSYVPAFVWSLCLIACAVLFAFKRRVGFVFIAVVFIASWTNAALLQRSDLPSDATVELTGIVSAVNEVSRSRVVVTLDDVTIDDSDPNTGVRLYIYGGADVALADRISLTANTWLPRSVTSPGGFDFKLYLAKKGVWLCATAKSDVEVLGNAGGAAIFLNSLREDIGRRVDEVFGDNAILAKAILLGDKSGMPDEMRQQFQDAGIAHLLAVSGLHITCLALAMAWLLRLIGISRFAAFAITAPLIAAYVVIIGLPPSAVRALIMYCAIELARVFGKRNDMLTSLGIAFLWLTAHNPLMITDGGLVMSFMAVMGINVFYPLLSSLAGGGGKIKRAVVGAASVTLSAQIGTLPAVATIFGALTPYSIVTNILAVPLCTLGLPFIAGAVLLSSAFPAAQVVIAALPNAFLTFMNDLAAFMSSLPGANVYVPAWPLWANAIFIALVIIMSPYSAVPVRLKRWLLLAPPALLMATVLIVRATLPGGLAITFADAGAADSAIVRAEGKTYFIDVGKEDCSSIDYLCYTGQGVDAVFLTHPHLDHAGGLESLLSVRDIPAIYLPVGWEEHGYIEAVEVARNRGTRVEYLSAGDEVPLSENITLTALNPVEGNEYSDTNGMSLVCLVTYGDGKALMTGDIPSKYEPEELPDCQLLKAAHHGSSRATSARLLKAVSPEIVVITDSGKLEGTSKKLLERIEASGAEVYHTGENGMVTAIINPDGTVEMESFL